MRSFSCAHCGTICDWTTRAPSDGHEIKTIGSRYCNSKECIAAEMAACDCSHCKSAATGTATFEQWLFAHGRAGALATPT